MFRAYLEHSLKQILGVRFPAERRGTAGNPTPKNDSEFPCRMARRSRELNREHPREWRFHRSIRAGCQKQARSDTQNRGWSEVRIVLCLRTRMQTTHIRAVNPSSASMQRILLRLRTCMQTTPPGQFSSVLQEARNCPRAF